MKFKFGMLLLDILFLVYIGITIYVWNDQDNFGKFRDIIYTIIVLVFLLDRHIYLFKKEKRVY